MLDRVIVRFRPNSKAQSRPSESLNLVLTSLADADEFQPLVAYQRCMTGLLDASGTIGK